ncbi:hypothetical protein [Streptomyces sp. NPDC127190]|uniref:hypothetical protein n=1 Tax=unclassified Streptomyces TaxID=2593676 RepID=UPI00363860D1
MLQGGVEGVLGKVVVGDAEDHVPVEVVDAADAAPPRDGLNVDAMAESLPDWCEQHAHQADHAV